MTSTDPSSTHSTGWALGLELFLTEAARALIRARLRSALASLGLFVGTAALISVVALGQAGASQVQAQLDALGENLVWVEAGSRNVNGLRTGSHGMNTLTPDDAEAISREVPGVRSVSPQADGSVFLGYSHNNWTTRYRGEGAAYFQIKRWPVAEGSEFTDAQVAQNANVVVLGQTVVEQLFGQEDPIGKLVRIQGQLFEVVGVLSPKGQSPEGRDQDDVIVLPYTTGLRKLRGVGFTWLDDIFISAVSADAVPEVTRQITELLRQRHHLAPGVPDDFNVRHPEEIIRAQLEAKNTTTTLLASIAALSLLIGAVGIANVMLVAVSQRTREIGLRLAVGAKPWQVLIQFLGEAVLLSLVGGALGIVGGVVGTAVLGKALGWPTELSPLLLLLAPAASILVGILAGFLPALGAAGVDPIVALRSE